MKTSQKERTLYYSQYYQRNQARKKAQQRTNYQKKKWTKIAQQSQVQQEAQQATYKAKSIKVLMSLKEYTELNRTKQKLWRNFASVLQDLAHHGISDIVQIQQLELLAVQLRQDYYATAKNEERQLKNDWRNLTSEQQQRLIRYWARQRFRKERELNTRLTYQFEQAEQFEKEIELTKRHEELGKQYCQCEHCQTAKNLRTENQHKIKQEQIKSLEAIYSANSPNLLACDNCGRMVKSSQWDEETDACKKCSQELGD